MAAPSRTAHSTTCSIAPRTSPVMPPSARRAMTTITTAASDGRGQPAVRPTSRWPRRAMATATAPAAVARASADGRRRSRRRARPAGPAARQPIATTAAPRPRAWALIEPGERDGRRQRADDDDAQHDRPAERGDAVGAVARILEDLESPLAASTHRPRRRPVSASPSSWNAPVSRTPTSTATAAPTASATTSPSTAAIAPTSGADERADDGEPGHGGGQVGRPPRPNRDPGQELRRRRGSPRQAVSHRRRRPSTALLHGRGDGRRQVGVEHARARCSWPAARRRRRRRPRRGRRRAAPCPGSAWLWASSRPRNTPGEGEHVVDLVGEVAAPGGDDRWRGGGRARDRSPGPGWRGRTRSSRGAIDATSASVRTLAADTPMNTSAPRRRRAPSGPVSPRWFVVLGDPAQRLVEVAAIGVDDARDVADDDVGGAGQQQQVEDGVARPHRPRTARCARPASVLSTTRSALVERGRARRSPCRAGRRGRPGCRAARAAGARSRSTAARRCPRG